MSSSNKPITPPMYATNDWIISRARALIDYDSYDEIEKWLDNSGDEDDTFEFPEYFEDLVGEIQDYDPDNRVLTPMTLVERLEAAAAKTEKYDNDEEQESDLEDINSHLSLAFSSGDELLPSTLVSHHRDRVVGKTGVAYASLDEMLYEHVPSMKIEPGFTTARVQTVSIPARTPSDNYALESIALPPPAYIATDRHRRKKYVRPRLYSYSDMDNMEKGLGIERGLSPIPRIRGNSFSRSPSPLSNFTSASASTLTPISSHIHPIPDSVPSESSAKFLLRTTRMTLMQPKAWLLVL
ncbi:hypothetical protein RRF57_007678 [Xylaria bambusicola]|uniref:Uncharacterized protein n=1 Tax=Xylaria bambusicola TaxID=326684 RepID=A0AAN7UVP7_9PEZI